MSLLAAVAAALAFTAPVPPNSYPVGFAGDGVLVASQHDLRLVSAGGSRRVGRFASILGAGGSSSRVIVATGYQSSTISDCAGGCPLGQGEGNGYGESQGAAGTDASDVYTGPLNGRLKKVASCPRLDAVGVPPVATGDVVAYRGCGATTVELPERSVPAGGTVVALAAEGRRVVWVAVRDGASSLVRSLDVDTGAVTDVGELKPLSTGPALTLSLAPGRVRISLQRQYGAGKLACRILDATAGGPLTPVDTHDCTRAQLTATGTVGVIRRTIRRPARLVARTGTEPVLARVLARLDEILPAVAADRVAFVRPDCVGQSLVVRKLASTAPPVTAPSCPVRAEPHTVRATPRGGADVTLRCPRGCDFVSASLAFRHHLRSSAPGGHAGPGGTVTFHFRFKPKAQADLRHRRRVFPGEVVLARRNSGATSVAIRLRHAAD